MDYIAFPENMCFKLPDNVSTEEEMCIRDRYKTSFLSYKMGYGSAMSIIILLVSLVLVGGSRTLLLKLTGGNKDE